MKYQPELGQAVFGQPYKTYGVSNLVIAALENISEEWDRVMWNIHQKEEPNPFGNTGAGWKCDTFEVDAYSWNEDYEQPYNFKWKDVEISWYKYLGRGMSSNKDIKPDIVSRMLDECLDALQKYESEHDTTTN